MQVFDQQFCFWDAKSLGDTCPLIVYMSIAAAVLIISSYRFIKFKKLNNETHDNHLKTCIELHFLISLWAVTYLIQNIYSITVFFRTLNIDPPPVNISSYSKIYTILDKIPTFVVQTIFIDICIFNYQGLYIKLQAKNFKINHTFYKKYIQFIFKGRIFLLFLCLLSLTIFQDQDQIWTTSTVNVLFVLADSIMVSIILVYSLSKFIKEGIQPNNLPKEVKIQIKREYLMMILTNIAGVLVNLVFLLYYPFYTDVISISCMEPVSNHWDFFFGHNIFGIMVLNFLPILWFLKMYSYRIKFQTSYQQKLNGSQPNTGQSLFFKNNTRQAF